MSIKRPFADPADATPTALAATEHELRCMVADRCSPAAVGLYALTRLESHAAAIVAARRNLLEVAFVAPAWSPLADPAVRVEIDNYLRSASRSQELGRVGPALDLHRRETETFAQRMELVLHQYGSPETAAALRGAVVGSATNIALAALVERYTHAGCRFALPNITSGDARLTGAQAADTGEAIYHAYGRSLTLRDRLHQWRHPKSLPTIRTTTVPSALGDVGEWAADLSHQLIHAEHVAPDFGAFVALEASLPARSSIEDHSLIDARVAAFREFEAQLPAVERAERGYILDITAPDGSHTATTRPPLIDVARLVTYRRIRNHADPIAVVKTNLSAVGIRGAMQVARAGEVALTRRYDELRYDRLQGAGGDVFRRPAGFDLHPRYRVAAQRAIETHTAPEFLDELVSTFRDGERDPEYLRIDRYISRLAEADLVGAAIGIIRPLTRGELINEPKWPARLTPFAELMFEEQEGARPLLNASGEMLDWQELVRRHPDSNIAEPAFGAMTAETENAWIQPAVDDAVAYAAPLRAI